MKIILKHLYFLLLCISISCTNAQKHDISIETNLKEDSIELSKVNIEVETSFEIDTSKIDLVFQTNGTYNQSKENIKKLRIKLSSEYLVLDDSISRIKFIDSISPIFTEKLLNEIVPYWYGTTWDFNGFTSKPNNGTIACGYFVSTTLNHLGINLNRYKLAQQGPENEASSIAIDSTSLKSIAENDIQLKLEALNDGLYFVGLDNHVGFLYVKDKESYFLHSNYIDGYVMIEKTISSNAFNSNNYYIAPISSNRLLIQKWLLKEELKIIFD